MTTIAPVTPAASAAPATSPSTAARFGFGDDGFGFDDFIDIINPLQHIPVVGTLYRAITGDTMAPAAEIAGGALFGGPIGALLSVADVAFTDATGKPIDQTMLAWVGLGDAEEQPAAPAVAQGAPPAVVHNAPAPAAPRNVAPSRAFPAATSRIVPLASYAPQARTAPATPAPQTATAAPANIVPETPVPTTPEQAVVSETAPAPQPAASVSAGPELQGAAALLAALRDSGVDPSSAARAAAAYQASLTLQSPAVRMPEEEAERH